LCADGILEVYGKRYRLKGNENYQKSKPIIGLLLTRLDNPYFSTLASSLEEYIRTKNADLAISVSDYDGTLERERIKKFIQDGVSGILACPWAAENENIYSTLSIPCVLIGRTFVHSSLDSVLVDNVKASEDTARHLVSCGCTEFFYVGPKHLSEDSRLSGYRSCLMQMGKELEDSHIIRIQDGCQIDKVLKEKIIFKNGKIGIFCYHDLFASNVIRYCHEEKIRIPEECAIVGFDNLPVASAIWPSLTTSAYPIRNIAETAANMLFERISGARVGTGKEVVLESHLIIRKSTE